MPNRSLKSRHEVDETLVRLEAGLARLEVIGLAIVGLISKDAAIQLERDLDMDRRDDA